MRPLLLALALMVGPGIAAGEVEISPDDSIFAVITRKGGFASGMAHDHLVAAADYRAELGFDPDAPLATRFELELAADRLVVDRRDLMRRWWLNLTDLGILEEGFGEVADRDREKIRESMLSEGQLDAAGSPSITARITEVRERALVHNGVSFPYVATLELEVRGKRVERPVAARFELGEGELNVEAFGTFRFTDFGIKPYSAFLGAVKNQDLFHVYVNLKGALAASVAPEPARD